ncbi:MAG: ATP-binding protein [Bacteroidota bacterium]
MKKAIHFISNIGITEDLNLSQQNQIILLNRIVAIFSFAIWLRFIIDIFDKDWTGAILGFVMGTLFTATFAFSYAQKFQTSKIYFLSNFIVLITLINILAGKGLGAEFGYFSIIVMVITFFDQVKSSVFFIALTIFCYVLCQFYFQIYESPLEHILNGSSYHFMFAANLICTTLASYTFVSENRKFSKQTNELLESSKQQNTKLEEAQLELGKQNAKLEAANKELEKFAYIASHDLKTPLRNITSFLSLISRKLKQSENKEVIEYIDFASKSAKQMHYLIQDILEFSRLNGENLSTAEVDLNEIILNVKDNIKGFIKDKNAVVSSQPLPTIQGHPSQLLLLFQNLVENAIKYNHSDQPSVSISCTSINEEYQIHIQDNGIGISQQYFDRIFEMFTRLHNQDEFQGSGIGLSICKKIAEYHGGRIQVTSEENQGTTFTICLPQVSAIPDFSLPETSTQQAGAFDLN